MPGLTAAGSDWSYGGSILTFVFPMILFLGVAAVLYMLYTKPQTVPGERAGRTHPRSVAATLDAMSPNQPGPPTAGQAPAGGGQVSAGAARPGPAAGGEAAAGAAGHADPPGGGQAAATGQAAAGGSAEGKE